MWHGEELSFLAQVNDWTSRVRFLSQGLRTLCIAKAEISEEFYDEWKHTFYKASTSLQNRDKKIEEAAELIEQVGLSVCLDERVDRTGGAVCLSRWTSW